MTQTPKREHPLARWLSARSGVRQVACVGDSITHGTAGRPPLGKGVERNWVEQLAAALDESTGARAGDGFRGLWRSHEWQYDGTWTRTDARAAYDVAPFGEGYFSSGNAGDTLTWTKPPEIVVAAFDIYWFSMPAAGNWQYRVDNGEWTNAGAPHATPDNLLHRDFVDAVVQERIEIRGFDGRMACVAPIAGISVYATRPPAATGTIVHNLGLNFESLTWFCRPSGGDPLALLDDLRPDVMTVLFSNDMQYGAVATYTDALRTLIARVQDYADVLVISPYEQRPPRSVDDAITQSGSTTVTSPTAAFGSLDVGLAALGTNIAPMTKIAAVASPHQATLSAPATGSSGGGALKIGFGREAAMQAEYRSSIKEVADAMGCAYLDLYDAWAERAGAGWQAANDFGLMHDRFHPSQLGHDDIAARVQRALSVRDL